MLMLLFKKLIRKFYWCICFLLLPQMASAIELHIDSVSGNSSTQVVVPIRAIDFLNIVGMQGSIQFNTSVVTYAGVEQFNLPGFSAGNFGTSQASNGIVTFLWDDASLNGVSRADSSILFALRFNVIGIAGTQSAISFVNTPIPLQFIDAAFNIVSGSFFNGMVNVPNTAQSNGLQFMADSVSGNSGTQVVIPIRAKNFDNIIGIQGSLQFDETIIAYAGIEQINLPGMGASAIGSSQASNGILTFLWDDASLNGISRADSSILFALKFNIIGNGGTQSALSFVNSPLAQQFVNTSFNTLSALFNDGKVFVIPNNTQTPIMQIMADSLNGNSGTEIVVPIRVKNFLSLISAQGTIEFDPTILNFINVEQFGLSGLNAASFGTSQTNAGKLSFSWSDGSLSGITKTDSSIIFAIRFSIIGATGTNSNISFSSNPTPLEFTNANFNTVQNASKNGKVQVNGILERFTFLADSVIGAPTSQVTLPIRAKFFKKIMALQGSISFNPTVAIYSGFNQSVLPGMSAASFNTSQANLGNIGFSWDDATLNGLTLADSSIIFSLNFTLLGSSLSETSVDFGSIPIPIEVIDSTFNAALFLTKSGKISTTIGDTIITQNVSNLNFCAGDSIQTSFFANGNFAVNNVFQLQLSDSSGSFSNPLVIGSIQDTIGGNIQGLLPLSILNGNAYRLRVVSTNPVLIGGSNNSNLQINAFPGIPVISASGALSFCDGNNVELTSNPAPAGYSYQWLNNNNLIANADSINLLVSQNGNYSVLYNGVCATDTSNILTVSVNPNLPVALFISASDTAICEGTTVVFTANALNGGTNPTYQWKINGLNVGTNSSVFQSDSLQNNDVITCELNSSENCTTGNPAVSNAIQISVSPILPVSVIITANEDTICQGTTVTFSANATNAGNNPTYVWQKNGLNVGSNSNNYIDVNLNSSDTIKCVVTSAELCRINNPAISNNVSINVIQNVNATINVSASIDTICEGSLISFSALVSNEGNSPNFLWKINGNAVGSNSSNFQTNSLNNSAFVSCTLTSSENCVLNNPVPDSSLVTVLPILPVSISISASTDTICDGETVTFSALGINGGTNPNYQWKINGSNVGTNNPVFQTSNLSSTDTVSCVLNSSLSCFSGNPAQSNSIVVYVKPNLPVSAQIIASADTICQGDNIIFQVNATNAGNNPIYQWKINGNNVGNNSSTFVSGTLNNNDVVTCLVTSSEACVLGNPALSNAITITVNPILNIALSISTSDTNICNGSNAIFTANAQNADANSVFQWKINGQNIGTNSSIFASNAIANNDTVICILTSNAACAINNPATSLPIIMGVSDFLPVSISINVSQNPSCAGTLLNFTAQPVNAGNNPIYQWKVNGFIVGSNSASFSASNLVSGDLVNCTLTSNYACATGNPAVSNTISAIVNPILPVSISIQANTNVICSGTNVVFTATNNNAGLNPIYQWKLNGNNVGTNANTYSNNTLNNNDVITCQLLSSELCTSNNPAVSNSITMTVNPVLPVSVSISTANTNICSGANATFTATAINGGTNPFYQWKKNGINEFSGSNTFSTTTLQNGDIITCEVTSDAICISGNPAISNAITITVNPNLPVSVSISSNNSVICQGTNVTFTAAATNGGSSPIYQWKINGSNVGSNSATFQSSTLNSNDVVTCTVNSSLACVSGNPSVSNGITMTVNPNLPVSVSIAASNNTICAGTLVNFTATAINGGSNPFYQWKINGGNVGSNLPTFSSSTLANGDVITCVITSNETCVIGNPATSNGVVMTVNPILPVSISITSTTNTICDGNSLTFTATASNGGTNPFYQWKINGGNVGTNSFQFSLNTLQNGDIVTCELTSNASCVSGNPAISNGITVTVNPLLPVSIFISANDTQICSGTMVDFSAFAINEGLNPVYQWKINSNNVGSNNSSFSSSTLNNGDVIVCELTSNALCASNNPATSDSITMIVNPNLSVSVFVSVSDSAICEGENVTFTAQGNNGGSNPIYDWKINGNSIGNGTSFQSNILNNNDLINCTLLSNALCAVNNPTVSNTISMEVNALPIIPQITRNVDTLFSSATSGNQWFVDGSEIPNAINVFHKALQNGTYIVEVTNSAGCSSESEPFLFNSLSTLEIIETEKAYLFPNPATSKIYLNLPFSAKKVSVIDLLNKIHLETTAQSGISTIDIQNLPSGLYFMIIQYENNVMETLKFLKQ